MSYREQDNFSTYIEGFSLASKLRALYLGIPLFILILIPLQLYDLLIGLIILGLYLVLITIALIFYFSHNNKKEWKEKRVMQDAEDRFYRNYFRKKGY